jgi:hypothetical protein
MSMSNELKTSVIEMNKMNENENENENEKEKIMKYIEQMAPLQKIAYEIAKKHLKSSFCIEKSIGYKHFKINYNL